MTQEERIRTELLKCERNACVTNFSLCMVQKTPFFFIRWSLKLEKKAQKDENVQAGEIQAQPSGKAKRAKRHGIIFTVAGKPPAVAEEELLLSGILAGEVG